MCILGIDGREQMAWELLLRRKRWGVVDDANDAKTVDKGRGEGKDEGKRVEKAQGRRARAREGESRRKQMYTSPGINKAVVHGEICQGP